MRDAGPPVFDSTEMPSPTKEYVCWIDIMGTGSIMPRSLETSAIFIFKLHEAAVKANERHDVCLYPMMDGVYVTSESKGCLSDYISDVFAALAHDVARNINNNKYKYIIKSSVAYGPVVHGKDIPEDACDHISNRYLESILVGMPMVQVYKTEREAPPFGVYLHESVRAFAPGSEFNHYWWEWFHKKNKNYHDLAEDLRNSLESYYEWCEKNNNKIGYSKEKITKHELLCKEYLPEA